MSQYRVIIWIIIGIAFIGLLSTTSIGALGRSRNDEYRNSQFDFSFQKPSGYSVSEVDDGGYKQVEVQSKDAHQGFQVGISLSPFDSADGVVTKSWINDYLSDFKVTDATERSIDNIRGVEFYTDDAAYDGASTEVWFVRK